MATKTWSVYLSGEPFRLARTHPGRRFQSEIARRFLQPVTDHDSSDNCGVEILGMEGNDFWKDHKGAQIPSAPAR